MQRFESLIDYCISQVLEVGEVLTPDERSLHKARLLEFLTRYAEENKAVAEISEILLQPDEGLTAYEDALGKVSLLIENEPAILNEIRKYLYSHSEPAGSTELRMVSSSGATALHGDVRQIGNQVAGRDLSVMNYSVSASPPPMPVARQLPPDVTDFCDRHAQLSIMRDHLFRAGTRPIGPAPPVCVFGQGGIGKTAIAIRMAHAVIDAFPDGQLYIDLRGVLSSPALPLNIIGEFLRALGIDGRRVPGDLDEAIALYRSTMAGRTVLIVLDNARDEGQVRPLLPTSKESRVLITSRRRLSGLEGATHLRLEVMSDSDSRMLLQQVVGDNRVQDDPRGAELVVRYAAGLPLALRICGARLSARPTWRVSRLADLLEDESKRLRNLRVGDLEVETSILASYNDLPMENQSRLRLLTVIEATQLCAWTAAALFDSSLDTAEHELEELVDSQLLAVGGVGPNGLQTYTLHDLVRAFLRSRLSDEERSDVAAAAVKRVMWSYLLLLQRANRELEAVDLLEDLAMSAPDIRQYDPELIVLPDVTAWLSFERESIISLVARSVRMGLPDLTWRLARGLAPFFDLRAYWSDWEVTHILALDATDGLEDETPEALVRRGLARLYEETSRWEESERQIRKAMLYFEANSGDAALHASCLRILGDLHRDQGRFAEAIEVYEVALGMFQLSSDRYWSAVLLRSLGDAHRDVGQWRQAVTYFDAARSAFVELGADRWVAAVSRSLATVYRDRGPYRRALEMFEEALPVFARVGDRSLEAQTLQGIGDTLRNMGKWTEATEPMEKARVMLAELGDMRRAAVAIRSLADMQRRMSNYDASTSLLAECTAIFERLGDRRWGLYTRRTEGLLVLDQGDPGRAVLIFEECYNAFSELGDERWRANCLRCLGDVYYAQGSYEQARAVLMESVTVFEQVEETRWLGKAYRSLGRVARAVQNEKAGTEYFLRALEVFREIDALADALIAEEELHGSSPV